MKWSNTKVYKDIKKRNPTIDGRYLSKQLTIAYEGYGGFCFLKHNLLTQAFTWEFTPQGYKFWHGINNGIWNLGMLLPGRG